MLIYANTLHLIPDWSQLFHPRKEISQFKSTFAQLSVKKAGKGGLVGGGWISLWSDVVAAGSRQKYVRRPHSVQIEKKKKKKKKERH